MLLRVLCGYFDNQRRVKFEGCVAEPLQTITAILPGSKWSCLLLRILLQDAFSEVMKVYPPLKLTVFVDEITASMDGRRKELASIAEEVLKVSITDGGSEEQSKVIASCSLLEEKLQGCS